MFAATWTMLPFVLFCDGDGNFVDGFSGAVSPKPFKQRLEALLAR